MSEYEIPRSSSLEHLSGVVHSSAVLIDSTHAIIAHQGTANDGFIVTVSWDSDFDNVTIVDTLEHSLTDASYVSLVKIDATHFALAYTDAELGVNDGHVKTFSIDGSYVITQVDSFEFDTSDGTWVSMVLVDSTHLAVAYTGVDSDGFIKTFSFDSGTGDNIALVDTLEHETVGPVTYNSLVLIDTTHLALAYVGVDGDGFLKTFSMGAGATSITEINVLEHDTVDAKWNSLALIDTAGGVTHLALAYASTGNDGFLKTFSTDSSYSTITQIASLEFDPAWGNTNSLVLIDTDASGSHFMQAYLNGSIQYVHTFSLDENYDNFASISRWQAGNSAAASNSSIIQIDGGHFFLSFATAATVGTFAIIPMGAAPAACPSAEPSGGSVGGGWSF